MAPTRRLVLIAGIALSFLALPAAANAIVYCVPDDTVDPSCDSGQGKTKIQDALDAAALSAGPDTVHVGAGSYSEFLNYFGSGTNTLVLEGEGNDQTHLTIPDTTGTPTGLTVNAPAGTIVRDLAMTIPTNVDSNGDRGVDLAGGSTAQGLLVNGPTATNATGIRLFGSASVTNTTVDLPSASPSNLGVLGNGSTSEASDLILHANTGARHIGTGTLTIERAMIQASQAGASLDQGTVVVRNSIIDLGASNGAVGVQAVNGNDAVDPLAAVLDGVTIVGGGTNSTGVQAQADSAAGAGGDPNDTAHDGEDTTVSVANTILSGQTKSLRIEADRGETARMTTSYSNYDQNTIVNTFDLTPGGGSGATIFSQTVVTSFPPNFISATNFHLAEGSGLIDAGDPAAASGTDIDGDPRALDGLNDCTDRRDIGADEVVPTAPTASFTSGPGPSAMTTDHTPTFTFASSRACAPSFVCSLDGAGFTACSSPFTTPTLADGSHQLRVRALGELSNPGPIAARSFTVKTPSSPPPPPSGSTPDAAAPETAITAHPKKKTAKRKARFEFASSEPGSSFLCSVDGKPYVPCGSPFVKKKLRRGKKHRFDVVAVDTAGNQDQTPATFRWRVLKKT